MSSDTLILGIEAAIEGGSVAIFSNDREIASACGSGDLSRAEDLLTTLDRLLMRTGHSRSEISEIAVSAGPGSFTGIRIGVATALGLALGLDIPVKRLSILSAIAATSERKGEVCVSVPMGRRTFVTQRFQVSDSEIRELSTPTSASEEEFALMREQESYLTPRDLASTLASCLCIGARDSRLPHDADLLFISKAAN